MSKADGDARKDPFGPSANPLLAKSAQGATYLVLLKVGSRIITFIINQVLLRYLSPAILGVSTQLDLFSSSTLYFSCESIRVALQRQTHDEAQEDPREQRAQGADRDTFRRRLANNYVSKKRAQETVNLTYIAIAIGLPLAWIISFVYVKSADEAVLQTPFIYEALHGYIVATILELFNEPCFAIAQQQMLYSTRASAETFATTTKCIITCAVAIWANRTNTELGVLPFAFGQLGYALVLNAVYLSTVIALAFENRFSIAPQALPTNPNLYLSLFSKPLVNLAGNLYSQSILKQLLTNGDSYLITLFTPLSAQGAYALAANYGGLIARILFQPIEESSRSFFARLLNTQAPPTNNKSPSPNPQNSPPNPTTQATTFLTTLLHFYLLLSTLILSLAPTLAPLALRTIAGPRWSHTEAPAVLAAYCYYIPLLALNGILEAFVSATATTAQLRTQSAWWFACSAAFVGSGYLVLRVCGWGAKGLVAANCMGMAARIWWSWGFVQAYLGERGERLEVRHLRPGTATLVGGVVSWVLLRRVEGSFEGGFMDVVKWAGVAGPYGMVVLFEEQAFLRQCYRSFRPGRAFKEGGKKEQ